jgi:hypothetical protein
MKVIRIWFARICFFNFFQGKKGIGYSWTDIWRKWKSSQNKKSEQKQ